MVAGNSRCGTPAAVAAYLARDDNLEPRITARFLTYPTFADENPENVVRYTEDRKKMLFDHEIESRSWWQKADSPVMND